MKTIPYSESGMSAKSKQIEALAGAAFRNAIRCQRIIAEMDGREIDLPDVSEFDAADREITTERQMWDNFFMVHPNCPHKDAILARLDDKNTDNIP
jgi:hypothetical protein